MLLSVSGADGMATAISPTLEQEIVGTSGSESLDQMMTDNRFSFADCEDMTMSDAWGPGFIEACRKQKEAESSNSDNSGLLSAAGEACIDFYMDYHVSETRTMHEPEKRLWSIGQELYLAKQKGR